MFRYLKTAIISLSRNPQLFFLKLLGYFNFLQHRTNSLPHPLNYQIEPTIRCNLACKMCAVKNDHSLYPNLTRKRFNNWLPKILPIESINLSGLGEPLLNHNLAYFIKKLSQKHISVFTISNSQLIDPQIADSLVQSGLNSMAISLESTRPKDYEAIRTGAKFARLHQALKTLSTRQLLLVLNIVILQPKSINFKFFKSFVDFAQKHGLPCLNFSVPDNVVSSKTFEYFRTHHLKISIIYKSALNYAHQKNVEIHLPNNHIRQGWCSSPWLFPYITTSGNVLPCCSILHLALASGQKRPDIIKAYSFGNLSSSNITRIWNSSRAQKFRQAFVDKKYSPYCLLCSRFYGLK